MPNDTGAAYTPYDTKVFRIGQDGLQLKKSLDMLSLTECSRLYNVITTAGGSLQTRPGQTTLASAGGTHHSIRRLNDPQAAAFTRFFGVGTQLLRGISGGLGPVDGGYSGNPMTMLPYRPPLAGASYMFVADSSKMSKTSRTGPTLPIGLPIPSGVTWTVNPSQTTLIADFDSTDGTNAANWTALLDTDSTGALINLIDETGAPPDGTGCVTMQLTFGTTTTDYKGYMYIQKALDLSKINGSIVATDDDFIHIAIRIDSPQSVSEIRIYFVVSPFGGVEIPGTSGTTNLSAYMGVIRPSDYTSYAAGAIDATTLASDLSTNTLLDTPSTQSALGPEIWSQFGSIGLPFRRSDFIKIGTAGQAGTDWSTVSAIFIVVKNFATTSSNVAFNDAFLTGGFGPDSAEPGAAQYDYVVTNYDPRTGAESNPSATQPTTAFVDALRQSINVVPAAFTDGNILQRVYRRGGTVTDNWYFVGTNSGNGASFLDTLDDASVVAAGAVEIDNDQPVTSIDANGNAIFAQPIPALWGPVDSLLMGCGDPQRPGDVYWCKPGSPDAWPAANHVEVCSPSEELMNGGVFSGQAFVFSRERMYVLHTNLASTTSGVVGTPTDTVPGMVNRWGLVTGPGGIYYIARDGIRSTKGGDSAIISDPIRPLFNGQIVNGYFPIDLTQSNALRLEIFNNDLWFLYKDTNGARQCLVYSLIYQSWRAYTFANLLNVVSADPTTTDAGLQLLLGGDNTTYTHSGLTDNGANINCQARTGSYDFGYSRGDTMFGDVVIDANMAGQTLALVTLLNNEQTTNNQILVAGVSGRNRYTFDPFGASGPAPQKARNVALDISWAGNGGAQPILEFAGVSIIPQPNVTMNRITAWDTPGDAECYSIGVWLDCDTGTMPRTVFVEYDLNGTVATAATLTINPNGLPGRHKWWFSWTVVKAYMIRLRPSDNCVPWELYEYRWLQQAEPPRIALWDTNWTDLGDSYYTGCDIECDTFGATKTLNFYVDQQIISTQTISANGRSHIHITFNPPGRGHLFRFTATDGNVGLLYNFKFIVDPEPLEQTNWNQNYTIAGSMSDKWLKGAILQCDTFGQTKSVNFEIDGVVVTTQNVNTNGRKVVEISFPQSMGRVFRMLPTDSNPGRLYSMEWIFDEEPLALTRWETQEVDHFITGWQLVTNAFVTIKSVADVTLTLTIYGQSGTLMATQTYTLPNTGGIKQKLYVPFSSAKGVLFKYLFTCGNPFWLYREESQVTVRPWNTQQTKLVKPFGNDDLDLVRGLHHASQMAGDSGGGEYVRAIRRG